MFKIIFFIIFLFILLIQFSNINNAHESFKNVFKENFANHNDKNNNDANNNLGNNNNIYNDDVIVKDIQSLVPEESYSKKMNNNSNSNSNNNSNNTEQCNSKKDKECLFGCPKKQDVIVKEDIKTEPQKERKTNVDEMMMTIEETEKICNLIEEKDKERKKREEQEHLRKQIELNKRFLVQQKAQNKQIEDLEKLIEKMKFTQEMNEVGIEKCGANADQCLTIKKNN